MYRERALSHQHRSSALHADDFTPALSIETLVCTYRELCRTKNILRIREPRIIGPYTESCGFMTHITMAQHDTNALMDYRYRPCIHTWPALYLGHKIRTLYRHLSKHLSKHLSSYVIDRSGGVPALVNKRWHSHFTVA